MTKPFWQGVFPAITTQFGKDELLDFEAIGDFLQAEHGGSLVVSMRT